MLVPCPDSLRSYTEDLCLHAELYTNGKQAGRKISITSFSLKSLCALFCDALLQNLPLKFILFSLTLRIHLNHKSKHKLPLRIAA